MSEIRQEPPLGSRIRCCSDCGLICNMPRRQEGMDIICPRCAKTFEAAHRHPLTWSLASALAGLLFYIVLLTAPLLEVTLYNQFRWSTMTTGLTFLNDEHFQILTVVILMTAVCFPLLKLLTLIYVLTVLHTHHRPQGMATLFRFIKSVNSWVMIEIFLLGLLVAYTRLEQLVHVHVEIAAYALIGLVLSVLGVDASLDEEIVWHRIHNKEDALTILQVSDKPLGCLVCNMAANAEQTICARCFAPLRFRKEGSSHRTWALVITATLLFFPANLYPILITTELNHTQSYTIFAGIKDFAMNGLWPLALLVFVASIVFPLFKLFALVFLLLKKNNRSRRTLIIYTNIYRFVDFIGRWSMIDIYMLSVLVGLVHFGQLAQIIPGIGAIFFAGVVVLSLFAVRSFDPRMIWDCCEKTNKEVSELGMT